MKLLLINHEYPPVGAGAATATEAIARNLHALGHDVTVMTSHYGELPHYRVEDGVRVYRASCLRRRPDCATVFEMFTFVVGAVLRLPTVLRKHQPNALIVFFSLPSGVLGLTAKLILGMPYIVSLRGGDVPGLVPELDWISKPLATVRRVVLKYSRAVVANSEGLRRLSEAADRHPVRVIPNGVNTESFHPGAVRSTSLHSAGPLRILFVGRFHAQKNLEFLLRQLARLGADALELHLVGDGLQREFLGKLADQLGIAKSITWHGWLLRSSLPRVYQSADCLVNPSLYEGMPNVVLEAMACGLPIVASKIPGHEALVIDQLTGFLFDLQKADELMSALRRMYDVDLRRRLGANGRARAVADFSWRSVAQAYMKIFEEAG